MKTLFPCVFIWLWRHHVETNLFRIHTSWYSTAKLCSQLFDIDQYFQQNLERCSRITRLLTLSGSDKWQFSNALNLLDVQLVVGTVTNCIQAQINFLTMHHVWSLSSSSESVSMWSSTVHTTTRTLEPGEVEYSSVLNVLINSILM